MIDKTDWLIFTFHGLETYVLTHHAPFLSQAARTTWEKRAFTLTGRPDERGGGGQGTLCPGPHLKSPPSQTNEGP